MCLDIKTLMISILGTSFVFVLSFLLYISEGRTQKGFKIWTASIIIQAVGYVFFILRGSLPALLSIMVGNSFFVLAAALRLDSITRFLQDRKIGKIYYIFPLLVALGTGSFYLFTDNILIRNVITTLGISYFTLYTGLKLIIYAPPKERYFYYFFAFFIFLIILSLVYRGVYWTLHPEQTFFTGSNIHTLHFYFDLLGQVGANALFIMIYSKNAESRLSRAMEEMNEIAVRDKLTGLYNRIKIDEILARECSRSARYGNPLSLIIVDIDFFKSVNDRFGHLEGDRVLQKVGRYLSDNIRQTDYAGRWGGEEFIIILPDTSVHDGEYVAEKLLQMIPRESRTNTLPEGVTVSIGLTRFEREDGVNDFLKKADEALYTAKEKGRNRTEIYRPVP